ncbi:MAG: hypothetical protein CMJ49_07850 [Planctomycetaceae bacterium]|nr:hypothetical protein [Planctomycetaceae bacterium]
MVTHMAKRKTTTTRGTRKKTTRRKTAKPLDPVALSNQFMQFQGGDINGALDELGENTPLLALSIRPLRPGMKMAGLAVTWNAVLAAEDPFDREDAKIKRWVRPTDFITPGTVLVYQPGGEMSHGHFGSLYGTMVQAAGANGVVVDGNLRDSDGHAALENWCAYSRGYSPLEAASRIIWLEPNKPVLMSGELQRWVTVYPGDMIFGDGDGVIVVPQRLIEPVLKKAGKIAGNEERAQADYAAGIDPDVVEKKWGAA